MPRTAPLSIVFSHPPLSARALVRMAVGAAVVVALGWVLGVAVTAGSPLPIEQQALEAVADRRTAGLTAVLAVVSHLGHLDVVVPLLLAAVPVLRLLTRAWEASVLVLLTFLGSLAVTAAVKVLAGRERPLDALIDASSAAFPSGHASRAAALLGLALWAVLSVARSHAVRAASAAVIVAATSAMGLSRIYLGIHWPTDVLFGYALGAWWVLVVVHAIQPRVVPAAVVPDDEPQITSPSHEAGDTPARVPSSSQGDGVPPGRRSSRPRHGQRPQGARRSRR